MRSPNARPTRQPVEERLATALQMPCSASRRLGCTKLARSQRSVTTKNGSLRTDVATEEDDIEDDEFEGEEEFDEDETPDDWWSYWQDPPDDVLDDSHEKPLRVTAKEKVTARLASWALRELTRPCCLNVLLLPAATVASCRGDAPPMLRPQAYRACHAPR